MLHFRGLFFLAAVALLESGCTGGLLDAAGLQSVVGSVVGSVVNADPLEEGFPSNGRGTA
jgi:hypothetical protein